MIILILEEEAETEVWHLTQSHAMGKWQTQDLKLDSPECELPKTNTCCIKKVCGGIKVSNREWP